MLSDRYTAKVLGAVVVMMTLLIDASIFMLTSAEIRQRPTFPLVVVVPSIPLFLLGAYLFRRASRLKVEDD